jgi:hypothetical protein
VFPLWLLEDAPDELTLPPKISSSKRLPTSFFAGAGLVGESFFGGGLVEAVPGLFSLGAIVWKGFFDYSNVGY